MTRIAALLRDYLVTSSGEVVVAVPNAKGIHLRSWKAA